MKIIKDPNGMYSEILYGLTEQEVKIILPYIEKALKQAQNKVEYYNDILDGGEATKRQTDSLCKWENKVEVLNSLVKSIRL